MRLGEYDFNEVSDTRRDFAVEKIFMHESYERKTYTNDISLLKLKQKATFTDFIWPICLPPSNLVLEGQTASVTGISLLLIKFCKCSMNADLQKKILMLSPLERFMFFVLN